MNVLMFGWEFPPHISGGLGTACQGLTEAMVNVGLGVFFVVPRLTGDEISAKVKFISASDVELPREDVQITNRSDRSTPIEREVPVEVESSSGDTTQKQTRFKSTHERTLSPYSYGEVSTPFQEWNYQLPASSKKIYTTTRSVEKTLPDLNYEVVPQTTAARKIKFSGTYGHDLVREVKDYARIAAIIAQSNDFDIIHAHDWISFPAGVRAKEVTGKKLVVHVHATEFDRSGESVNPEVFEFERQGMMAADHVVAVSEWTRQIIISRYSIASEKVSVVHNGIIAKKKEVSSSISPLGSKIVTFLGRVTHQKGPFYFAEAARLVLEKFPDTHFVVVGSGDLLPPMIEFVARKKMSANFHFTGFLKGANVDRIWEITNVYVMPSVSEPFGLTPLEAMQSGVPVIISRQSGVSEVMRHAIKIDFWNTRSLASAICSLLAYESLSENLKTNSVKEIHRINWDGPAKKIKQIYHELTNTQPVYETSDPLFSGSSAKTAPQL